MEQYRNLPRLCFLLTAALSLLGVVLRSVCMLYCFDADIGYFADGILPTLSHILYFVAILAPIVCSIRTPKGQLSTEFRIANRSILATVLGIFMAGFAVALLVNILSEGLTVAEAGRFTPWLCLLGLAASTYYFSSARRDGRYPDWLSFLGYLPILWGVTAVADTYFDGFTAMNSPVKISIQLGILGFMLMVLAELRFRVGKPMPRYSVAFLSIGSFTCLVGSIPLLAAVCAGVISHVRHTLYAMVLLSAGVYGLYLLYRYTAAPASLSADTPEPPSAEPHNTAE